MMKGGGNAVHPAARGARLLTPKQAAQSLAAAGFPKDAETLRRWIKQGVLKGKRIGGRWYVPEREVERYVAEN